MKAQSRLSCLIVLLLISVANTQELPDYQNPELSTPRRVDDLLARMTLEEKVTQMLDVAPPIERLGIPAYNWWNECLHGVARAGVATVFPQAIGLAATWNTDLMFEVADVISTEARAKYHEALRQDNHARYYGLTMWSPNINIFRDPRWGRGQETYGEDPYLTARMGVAFVKGLQGNDAKYLKVVSTPKHYAVHSGPEPDRHVFDAITDSRDLYETYLPAFEATVVEANAWSIMCAYNRYLGEACCGSPVLLQKILREDWGFEGYIVSDCGAIRDIYAFHKITENAAEAAALAVKSGTDLNCGSTYRALNEAVEKKLITEDELDVSLRRLFTARFKLGMFDPPEAVVYAQIPFEKNDCEEHRLLSLRAARESMVLLKNDGILPLSKTLKRIAVIGPNADNLPVLLGNYNGTPSNPVSILKGIQNKVGDQTEVVYTMGCSHTDNNPPASLIPKDVLFHGGQSGLKAEYFTNTDLSGEPFITRVDEKIRNTWLRKRIDGLGRENFSIRWTGEIVPKESGDYLISVTGDDGYRLFFDNQAIIENWSTHAPEKQSAMVSLKKGTATALKLEFFQGGGGAEIALEWAKPELDPDAETLSLAQSADIIIFAGGISPRLEGEEMPVHIDGFTGGDRTKIGLPQVQVDLLKKLHATGKPVILVSMSGSALALNWSNANLPAILHAWYPGQEGGTAVADILFGDYNPAGRLPLTFYKSVDQLPPFDDYNMKERTYKYFTQDPLYAFGHGLSYTTFEYSDLKLAQTIEAGENLDIEVKVRNAGNIAGDEVVQVYVTDLKASHPVPLLELLGSKRIHLKAGDSKTVAFTITPRQLALWDDAANNILEPGLFSLSVGGRQPNQNAGAMDVLTTAFQVVGKPLRFK